MRTSSVYRVSVGFASQIIALAAGTAERFVAAGVLLRAWGVDLFADWSVLFAAAGLAALAELGTNVTFSNRFQASVASGHRADLPREVGIALAISSILALLAFSIAAAFTFSGMLNLSIRLSPEGYKIAEYVFIFFVLDYAIRLPSGAITEVYRAIGKFARAQILYTTATIGRIVVYICVFLFDVGPVSVSILLLVASIVVFWGIFVLDARYKYNIRLLLVMASGKDIKSIIDVSKWYAAQSWALQLWNVAPPLIIAHIAGSGPLVASFVLVRTLANSLRQIPAMFATAACIEIARSHFENAHDIIPERLLQTGKMTCALSGLMAGFLLGFGDVVISLWTGKPELYNPILLALFVVPLLIIAPAVPFHQFLHLGNFPRQIGTARILQLLLMLSCVIPMTLAFGVHGCALGLAVSETVSVGGYLLVVGLRAGGVRPVHYLSRCIFVVFASASISWGIAAGIKHLVADDSPLGLAVSVSGWGVVAAFPLVWSVVPDTLRRRATDRIKSG